MLSACCSSSVHYFSSLCIWACGSTPPHISDPSTAGSTVSPWSSGAFRSLTAAKTSWSVSSITSVSALEDVKVLRNFSVFFCVTFRNNQFICNDSQCSRITVKSTFYTQNLHTCMYVPIHVHIHVPCAFVTVALLRPSVVITISKTIQLQGFATVIIFFFASPPVCPIAINCCHVLLLYCVPNWIPPSFTVMSSISGLCVIKT